MPSHPGNLKKETVKMRLANDIRRSQAGFTLVELLVVITIIVILLALLVPAMDKAMYQASLAVCGANQKGVAASMSTYAVQFQRSYPTRALMAAGNEPLMIASEHGDDRPLLGQYISFKALRDPMVDQVPMSIQETAAGARVHASYEMWAGTQFPPNRGHTFTGMKRIGDRFSWFDDADFSAANAGKDYNSRGYLIKSSLLVSDQDFAGFNRRVINSHPDDAGLLPLQTFRAPANEPADETGDGIPANYSRYEVGEGQGQNRGKTEANHAYDDGSVIRLNGLTLDYDDRLGQVPYNTGGSTWSHWSLQIPVR